VRGGARRQAQMRENPGLGRGIRFLSPFTDRLTQKRECERLLMSECAKVRSWPRLYEKAAMREKGDGFSHAIAVNLG
jgi:hypothetical protein